ncbi:MAG: methionine--tRNA ligase [Candidatus Tectomicrobia bacterium]|uniref:Methionine--tRNA ligase n=1 Tax=Tectimicrobiota bacterium TaxID=2528274 RepID=A0A932FW06_UNCTE|nr:methionine--tRNA ligase [Candidatus Tectomicrobia bacterium]
MSPKTFYVTTPIYYVNDVPHIGHAYTTIAADVLARYRRLAGDTVRFLTGTDEHGQKVERAARERGESPQALADRVMARFQALWDRLQISHDDFIRTTEPRHKAAVAAFFQKIYDQGDIYLGDYEGWYCTPCETFLTEMQLVEGKCPDCGRLTDRVKESSLFFRMSRYQEPLLRHIEAHEDFIQPVSRRNEILSFVQGGLRDLSISRTSFRWGIPAPGFEGHVIYVWVDALTNYISALGYPEAELFHRFWPADVHLVGKDILRFHTVYWPTMLMAAGLPLPQKVFAHGWWTVEGRKMSKSLQNVVEPHRLIDLYGADALRYFLLREVSFGLDGDFSHQGLILRINSDLANDLGNLFSRTLAMLQRYFKGQVPTPDAASAASGGELKAKASGLRKEVEADLEELAFHRALGRIWELINAANKYIDETAPWKLAKSPDQKGELSTVLYNLAETLRVVALWVAPFMPQTAEEMWQQLGQEGRIWDQRLEREEWGQLRPGVQTRPGKQLFPRIEKEQAGEITQQIQSSLPGEKGAEKRATITLEEFKKVELRAARVLAAEPVPKSNKLLKLRVSLGTEERTVVAGIATSYSPQEMVGRTIIIVANLEPAKLMGIESQGMILAADGEARLALATFVEEVRPGMPIK